MAKAKKTVSKKEPKKDSKPKAQKKENLYADKDPSELLMLKAILTDKISKLSKEKSEDEDIKDAKEKIEKAQEFDVTPTIEKMQAQISELNEKINLEKDLDTEKIKKLKADLKELEDEYKESEKTLKGSLKDVDSALYAIGKEEEKKQKSKELDE